MRDTCALLRQRLGDAEVHLQREGALALEVRRRRLHDRLELRHLCPRGGELLPQAVHLVHERLHVEEAEVVAAVVAGDLLAQGLHAGA